MIWTSIEAAVCNGCLRPLAPKLREPVQIGEFSFHPKCAPVCVACGRPVRRGPRGQYVDYVVLDSQVEFAPDHGYRVRLKVCCCGECYEQSAHDEPPALA